MRAPDARPLTPGDVDACLGLSREAGWNQTAADWRLTIALGPTRGLFLGPRLVATALAVPHGDAFGWIAMVLVTPSERRKGHARRLLDWAVARLAQDGRAAGLDATPLGQPLYTSLGFRPIGTLTRYAADAPIHVARSDGIRPIAPSDWPDILRFDRTAFGADRSAILRHLAERLPDGAHAVRRDGRLAGYVLARDGVNATQVGPLIAGDASTAGALLAAALATASGPVVVDAPGGPAGLDKALLAHGFAARRTFVRMVLGEARAEDPARIFAAVGPEFG